MSTATTPRQHHPPTTAASTPGSGDFASPSFFSPSTSTMMATSGATASSSQQATPAMSKTSSGMEQPSGFDLPPMPVPYEDFHFSLDLPDNLQASDLSLLQSSDFETLFGGSSGAGSMTPSLVSSSALFGTATPAVHTPAAATGGPTGNTPMGQTGHGGEDSVMTSTPSGSGSQPPAGPPQPPTGPPPPPPQGEGMFSFDSLFGGVKSPTEASSRPGPSNTMPGLVISSNPNASQPWPPSSSSHPHLQPHHYQHQQPHQQFPSGHGVGGPPFPAPPPPQPLFDTRETDFLSSFLEGFEQNWDFNPAGMPENMPSFAIAAAQHHARYPSGPGYAASSSSADGRTPTGQAGGSSSNSSGGQTVTSPREGTISGRRRGKRVGTGTHSYGRGESTTPPGGAASMDDVTSSAAFGTHHLDDMDDEDEDGSTSYGKGPGAGALGSKRSHAALNGRIGDEKRRGSLAISQQQAESSLQGNVGFMPPSAAWSAFSQQQQQQQHSSSHSRHARAPSSSASASASAADLAKRELLSEKEKRQNHILSEQRRRNHIREGFTELVTLLDLGRLYGARGLGLSSGAGTGIEDEGLDDRTDVESCEEESDEEMRAVARQRRKKARQKKTQALQAAKAAALAAAAAAGGPGSSSAAAAAAAASAAASRGKGKGRGRGGSAGGGAGSKSAVLFQAVDLMRWLAEKNAKVEEECRLLEEAAGSGPEPIQVPGALGPTLDGTGGAAQEEGEKAVPVQAAA